MYESEYASSSLGVGARQNFVKKVYSILSAQLLVTVAMVLIDYKFKGYGRFQERNNWAFWLAFIGAMGSLIALCKNPSIQSSERSQEASPPTSQC